MKKNDYYIVKSKRSPLNQFFRDFSKWLLLLALKIQGWLLLKNQSIETTRIDNILILAYMGIGDLIMYTPALKKLRQHFPHAKITLQTGLKNYCEQVILNSSLVDEVQEVILDRNFLKFIRHGWHQRQRFDLLISEFHNPYFELAFQILFQSIPVRIGHVTSPGFHSPFDFLFNYPIKMKEAQHTIERELLLLEPLGISTKLENEQNNTEIYLSNSDVEFAQNYWIEKKLTNQKVIGIQGGTAPLGHWKQWPLEKFTQLVQILRTRGFQVLLFGSPAERLMLEKLARNVQPQPLVLAGACTFLQSCALIGQCDYMITNDSGLMHVANALETPLTAIYGPTDYRRTAPLAATSKIVRLDLPCSPCFRLEGEAQVRNCPYNYKCLNEISVEMVLNSIQLKTDSEG